jgi:muconolactone delta-isomerase
MRVVYVANARKQHGRNGMKFLLETELYPHAPIERLKELITEQLARRSQDQNEDLRSVRVEAAYGVLGRRGAIAILDAPDADTLQRVLVQAPLFHFEKMTVTALVDLSKSLSLMADSAERRAGS